MHAQPRFLGAAAAVLVVGVAGGAILGNVPPMKQAGLADYLPVEHSPKFVLEAPTRLPPDQYPIVTPEGRFEVAELSWRGLYRTARYAPSYGAETSYIDLSTAYEQPEPQPPVGIAAADRPPDVITIPDAEPLPEAPAASPAGPRVIDVAAELAAQSELGG
jgi:hypothetical protein